MFHRMILNICFNKIYTKKIWDDSMKRGVFI
jgi:hypothetical protein